LNPVRAAGVPTGIDGVFNLANQVAADARQVAVYEEEDQELPGELSERLSQKEFELDDLVARLLQRMPNLKASILNNPQLNERNMRELEWSYQKAVGYVEMEGRHSRLLFLPYIYQRSGNKKGAQEVNFTAGAPAGDKNRAALSSVLVNFVGQNMGDGEDWEMALPGLAVILGTPIREWILVEEEEKFLPKLHWAVINDTEAELNKVFLTQREKKRLADAGELDDVAGGWTMGVLPIAFSHEDEDFLSQIDFQEFAPLFKEEFDQLFDPEGEKGYYAPIDPNQSQEESTLRIWERVVTMCVYEGISLLKKGRAMIIDAFIDVTEQGEAAHVSLEIKVGSDRAAASAGHDELFMTHRIDRPGFDGERATDIATLFMEKAELARPDVRFLFSSQIVGSGPLGGDGLGADADE